MNDNICAGNNFSTFEEQDKILVGLSGGVDSSVCIQILKDQGFAVEALVINFSPSHEKAVDAAKVVAAQLDIPLHVENCYDLFEEKVITPFCQDYCNGVTPNPCVICNPNVKFKLLIKVADSLGINLIATGHYARVDEGENGIYYIQKAVSTARDQSYMLYRLPQDVLSRLCLPLGEFEKPDIREMAVELKLASADAPDSQEICFIPDGDYPNYIAQRGMTSKQGNFIAPEGTVIREHKGILHYTVGQRRGLHIALGKPVFIKSILDTGDILLGYAGEEFSNGFTLQDVVTSENAPLNGDLYVKIRSAATPTLCTVTTVGNDVTVMFPEPVRAPAPGQSAVFYRDDLVVGGGFIKNIIQ